jgi:hypothetical protein
MLKVRQAIGLVLPTLDADMPNRIAGAVLQHQDQAPDQCLVDVRSDA